MTGDHLELRHLAEAQHGLVATTQLSSLGFDRKAVHRLANGREWERPNLATLRVRGTPRTLAQRALAAVLAAGESAALSHRSAAAWWELPGFTAEPFEIARLRNSTARGGDGIAHEPRRLPASHVALHKGVPVTIPERTLIDLAARHSPKRIERILDTFWAQGLLSWSSLDQVVTELGGRGRKGIGVVRELLAERQGSYVPPESGLEARFVELIAGAGDESFERQVNIADESGWIGRVDFLDAARRLVVEVDSLRYHTSPSDRRRDTERDQRLEAAGYSVHRVTEPELLERPEHVLVRVRRIRALIDEAHRTAS